MSPHYVRISSQGGGGLGMSPARHLDTAYPCDFALQALSVTKTDP